MQIPHDVHLERRLEALHLRLHDMTGRACALLDSGLRCVVSRDDGAGRAVLRGDRDLDRLEMEVDRVAKGSLEAGLLPERSLRFVVSALKASTDLERVGDEAVKLAHAGLLVLDAPLVVERRAIEALGRPVREMLVDAVRAFHEGVPSLARAVIDRDDDIDDAYRVLAGDLRQRMAADLAALERFAQIRLAAKCLERIADHATNLAEQAIFRATGEDVRHRRSRG